MGGYWSLKLGYWGIESVKQGYWDIEFVEIGILGYWDIDSSRRAFDGWMKAFRNPDIEISDHLYWGPVKRFSRESADMIDRQTCRQRDRHTGSDQIQELGVQERLDLLSATS